MYKGNMYISRYGDDWTTAGLWVFPKWLENEIFPLLYMYNTKGYEKWNSIHEGIVPWVYYYYDY